MDQIREERVMVLLSMCLGDQTFGSAAWQFSLDEMMQNFERQRDQEFASHVCAEHPPTKGQERQNEPRVRGRSDDQAES